MSRDQYELLLQYATGTRTADSVLDALKKKIDTANSVKRFFLFIRWMESGGAPPTRIEIGNGWPPTQQFELHMDRAISRDDVDTVLRTQAIRPVSPVVTTDPGGTLGWTELDVWDFDTNA